MTIDSLKKTLLAGIGVAAVTKDRVLAGLDVFVAQGKLSATDARAVAEKVAADSREQFELARARVGEKAQELKAYADGQHLRRLAALEARVAALEAKAPKAPRIRAKP
jgi:polyhydroxyalkanoate synthesis regulator phasin